MKKIFTIIFLIGSWTVGCFALPKNFVYLKDIDPRIIQEMRYATNHNFVGRPIRGYEASTCVLTYSAALALKKVQDELMQKGLSLKVYDCYRPQTAVNDFLHWSKQPQYQKMKTEFYPRINKNKLFDLGYIALASGHSRGSTVDLTIVNLNKRQPTNFISGTKLAACFAPLALRYPDNSIDMGTGYDCMDQTANFDNKAICKRAQLNRRFLRQVMIRNGFDPYEKEWWHFTLRDEPFKANYFNFPVK